MRSEELWGGTYPAYMALGAHIMGQSSKFLLLGASGPYISLHLARTRGRVMPPHSSHSLLRLNQCCERGFKCFAFK